MKLRTWKRRASRLVRMAIQRMRRRRDWSDRWSADFEPIYRVNADDIASLRTRQGRYEHVERLIYNGYLPEMPGRPQDRIAAHALVYGSDA